MKTRQDNDVTNCTGVVYAKNEIEFLWSIRLSVMCDKNQTGQQRDQLILHLGSMKKTKLHYCDWSDQVTTMTKTK